MHGQTEGRADGRADSPYFIGPFRLPAGVQKKTIKLRKSIKEEKTITNITISSWNSFLLQGYIWTKYISETGF